MKPVLIREIDDVVTGKRRHPVLEYALGSLAIAYGSLVSLRRSLYALERLRRFRLPCPVLSVGNITVGGTGKTPMVVLLARMMTALGRRVVVLSRGYGGSASKQGAVVSDGERLLMDAAEAGDEPVLIARGCPGVPVVVSRRRAAAGMLAWERFRPDWILLDDGFQHLVLYRDVDLVLLDAQRPFGNGKLLPRGPLREPIEALRFADAFVMTRCEGGDTVTLPHAVSYQEKPLFRSRHIPRLRSIVEAAHPIPIDSIGTDESGLSRDVLLGRRILRFSGIADNSRVDRSIEALGGNVVHRVDFPDHHAFTAHDLREIERQADRHGADLLLTTDKDAVRMIGRVRFGLPVGILGVDIEILEADRPGFDMWLNQTLERSINRITG